MAAFEVKYDQEHFKRLEQIYVRKIEQLYLSANREAISIAKSLGVSYNPDKPFAFEDYPQTKGRVDKLFQSFEKRMVNTVNRATKEEWLASVEKNDELVNRIIKNSKLKREELQHLYNRNLQSLAAFQKRKVLGMNLSDRVWKYSNQYKGQIEMGLDVGLSDGRSAAAISRDLREYLQNPDKLFRRVRDKRGDLVLSKNAKKYHPGPGAYRSSYKNALRMTRTEVNMAYRSSDFERWQQLDFVVGIEVRRSNHVFACVLCDTLVGKYPKNFMFRGWHPQCRCYVTTILSSIDEFIAREKARMEGESLGPLRSVNEVKDVPANYANWITGNQVKIEQAKHKPFFIKDNLKYSGDLLLSSEIKVLRSKALNVGDDIDTLAKEFAERFGGYVSPINYKSTDSIKRKALDELNGRVDEIKDSVRNTIVLPKNRIEEAIEALQKDERFMRVKRQFAESDPLGYSGTIANVKAKNGVVAEIQINTERMIYAKEKPENAIRILGQKRWDEIHKATGLEGGLGHEYYEEWRLLVKESSRAGELQNLSKTYYAKFINKYIAEKKKTQSGR